VVQYVYRGTSSEERSKDTSNQIYHLAKTLSQTQKYIMQRKDFRIIEVAVARVANDPAQGFKLVQGYMFAKLLIITYHSFHSH